MPFCVDPEEEAPMRGRYLILTLAIAILVVIPQTAFASGNSDSDQTSALAVLSKSRILPLGRLSGSAPDGTPFRRVDGTTGIGSIVLPRRTDPYQLPELAKQFPDSIVSSGDGVYLLNDDVIVGHGATLLIEGRTVHEVRLRSMPDHFITITAWRGAITVAGTEYQPVAITSWNPNENGPDLDEADGRAWVQTSRGTMDLTWANTSYLGFATGTLSGVAWEGRPDEQVNGSATYSNFLHNHFGAYTFEAAGMVWRYNTFAYNTGYGLDPHDHSNHFTVEYNRAFNNGTHGIIFSRGCDNNVIRFNASYDNGTHGIVLDDGPNVNPDGTLRERAGIPSNNNTVAQNTVYGNTIGIVLDGGTGNTISGNVIRGNTYGIRMKDAVEQNTVTGNHFIDNTAFGIYLYNGSDRNVISGNSVSGGTSGVVIKDSAANQVDSNTLQGIGDRGIVFIGNVSGSVITNNEAAQVKMPLSLPDAAVSGPVTMLGNSFDASRPSDTHPRSIHVPAIRWLVWALILLFPVLLGSRIMRLFRSARASWPIALRPK